MAVNRSHGGGIPPAIVTAVLVVFVLGWAASLGAEIFNPTYNAPTGVNETMIALVTAFFVAQQRLGGKSSNDKEDDSKDEDKDPAP